MRSRCAKKTASVVATTACIPCWSKAANARSISSTLPAATGVMERPTRSPATCTFLRTEAKLGLLRLPRTPMRDALGAIIASSSSCFGAVSLEEAARPVMLPPGWAKLAKAVADRIGRINPDYRNRGGRVLQTADRRSCRGDDNVYFQSNEFSRKVGEPLILLVRRAPFDHEVLVLDIAELTHAFHEAGVVARISFAWRAGQKPDAPDLRRLLRERRERPNRHRPAQHRYELAPPHSITASARASKDWGTDKPSAFAVFKLMASSYLFGASTGKSAGFSPRNMRST